MNPRLYVIDTNDKLIELKNYLKNKQYVAFDTETTGVTKGSEVIGFSICAEENVAYYIILAKWNVHSQRLDYTGLNEQAKLIIQILTDKSLVMHNAVFDCMIVEDFFKVKLIQSVHTDTMVLAHLLNENRRIGLKELAKEYYGEDAANEAKEMKESVIKNGGKLTKTCYEMYKCDPMIMAKYGAKDALLTYRLFKTLLTELFEQNLTEFFFEESMPLLTGPTYELNNTGLQVDVNALTELKKTLEAECSADMAFVQKEISSYIKDKYPGTNKNNTFNVSSNQQLSWLLYGKLELEFGTLTKKGKDVCKDLGIKIPYSYKAKLEFKRECETSTNPKYNNPYKFIKTDKNTLAKFAREYKWVERLLEYQKKHKLLNTYVKGIEDRMRYGVINPSFLQTGTTSGRYSSRNPNFQNLPREDKRIKSCLIARPTKVFVSADYSQLEPRVFSFYSKDPKLMSAFDGTSDFYSVVGQAVYDKYDCEPQKEGANAFGTKYKRLRDLSKVIALASAYGATPNQLAPTTGKNADETREDMEKYFERFPGVQTMMVEAHELAKKQGYVTSYFGRPRRMPEAMKIVKLYGQAKHWDLPYNARSLLNLACNHRIQSTGASICNRAMIKFYNLVRKLKIKECHIVSQIHDEIVVECLEKDATKVNKLLQYCMENTVLLEGMPLEAIPRVTKTLAK
jgi:DNA polymerase-1